MRFSMSIPQVLVEIFLSTIKETQSKLIKAEQSKKGSQEVIGMGRSTQCCKEILRVVHKRSQEQPSKNSFF